MTEDCVGYVVERQYSLMTSEEYEKKYSLKASESGLAFSTFQDEVGNKITAIAICDGEPKRTLKVFNTVSLRANEWLHHGSNQLRRGQAAEIRSLYRNDLRSCSDTPKVLYGKPPISSEELERKAAEKKEALEAERQEQIKLAKLQEAAASESGAAVPAAAAAPPHTLLSDSENDSDELEHQRRVAWLPSQRAKMEKNSQKKKKEKQKAAALAAKTANKNKGKAGAASVSVARASASATSNLTVESLASAGAESCASDSTGKPAAETMSQVSGHASTASKTTTGRQMAQCDLTKILAGQLLGDKFYALKRSLESLARDAKTAQEHAEVNAVRLHCEMTQLAQEHWGVSEQKG